MSLSSWPQGEKLLSREREREAFVGEELMGSLLKGSFDKRVRIDLPVPLPVPTPPSPPLTTPHHPPEPNPKPLPRTQIGTRISLRKLPRVNLLRAFGGLFGAFFLGKSRRKSTQKSTAKFKSDFRSFTAISRFYTALLFTMAVELWHDRSADSCTSPFTNKRREAQQPDARHPFQEHRNRRKKSLRFQITKCQIASLLQKSEKIARKSPEKSLLGDAPEQFESRYV